MAEPTISTIPLQFPGKNAPVALGSGCGKRHERCAEYSIVGEYDGPGKRIKMDCKMTHRMLFALMCLGLGFAGCEPPTAHSPAGEVSRHRAGNPITILAWNVESGGSDPAVIARQLGEMAPADIYALSEVSPRFFNQFALALGPAFQSVESETGLGDRLQLLFDASRFDLVRREEMHEYRGQPLNNGTHRSPLLIHLREQASGVEFQVMVNHLARRNEELRRQQAIGLREWARDQALPTIAVGDFNFDYDFHTQGGNEAFAEFLRDDVWHWVYPIEWIDTNWADPDGDGRDNYPDSMLDFAFVAGPATDWWTACRVIVRDGDFPDGPQQSDHRPIELIVRPPLPETPPFAETPTVTVPTEASDNPFGEAPVARPLTR